MILKYDVLKQRNDFKGSALFCNFLSLYLVHYDIDFEIERPQLMFAYLNETSHLKVNNLLRPFSPKLFKNHFFFFFFEF